MKKIIGFLNNCFKKNKKVEPYKKVYYIMHGYTVMMTKLYQILTKKWYVDYLL